MADENYIYVKDIVKSPYVIGTYQRGYRWTITNVQEYLEDIFEGHLVEYYERDNNFGNDLTYDTLIGLLRDKSKNVEDYCLQPLVIKKNDAIYSVIDGQQRLTTTFIVLKALCDLNQMTFPPSFSIEFESREKSTEFLKTICESSIANDLDSAYMKQTYDCAKKWFIEKYTNFSKYLTQELKEDTFTKVQFYRYLYGIINDHTKFIWDYIEKDSPEYEKTEQKIFADRNTGKIDLTDSELIKALFMNPEYYGNNVNIEDKQILISELWDLYENDLHNDEFWRFIPLSNDIKKEYEKSTRIDAIFFLIALHKKIEINRTEENWLYKAIKTWIDSELYNNLKTEKKIIMISCWREVCDTFDGLKELYKDDQIYNLLSLYNMFEIESEDKYQAYLSSIEHNKRNRANYIKKIIIQKLFGNETPEKVIKNARYHSDIQTIRNILIAYNIAITNSSYPVSRFNFRFFGNDIGNWHRKGEDEKSYEWHVEHIYSTNESFLEKSTSSEQISFLDLFTDTSNDYFREYIEFLHNFNLDDFINDEKDEKTFITSCFTRSQEKYDTFFDIWRYLKVKENSTLLKYKYRILLDIKEILGLKENQKIENAEIEKFDIENANLFLHKPEYSDPEVSIFLRSDFLFWDDSIEKQFISLRENKSSDLHVLWHGRIEEISDDIEFWKKYDEDETRHQTNFIRGYYRQLLREIYDNDGIQGQDLSLSRHGTMKTTPINENNKDLFFSFFKGTASRIEEVISRFFARPETSINSQSDDKGSVEDYRTFASLINDNSMGNMMLLPQKVNIAYEYRNANFAGKRQYVANNKDVYLPIGTSNVLMGQFIDLSSSSEQWLMEERLKYIKDLIKVITDYFFGE